MAKGKKQKAANRERQRLKRAAEIDALMDKRSVPSDAMKIYEDQIARASKEERRQELRAELEQWMDGQHTPGAREAARRLVEIMRQIGKAPAIPKISKGDKSHLIEFVAPDGSKVTVDTKSHPLLRIYRNGGVDAPQLEAANRFRRDYDSAMNTGIRGPGYEPRVDTSGFGGVNLYSVDAQRRLSDLRKSLIESRDEALYLVLEAVCGCDMNISDIHDLGGEDKKVISNMLQRALNKAAAFYDLIDREPETKTVRALREVLFEAAKRRGEHVI